MMRVSDLADGDDPNGGPLLAEMVRASPSRKRSPGRICQFRVHLLAGAVVLIGAVLVTGGALTVGGAFSGGGNPGLVVVIPPKTSHTVTEPGHTSVIQIPTDIRFGHDDEATITIINRDRVIERAGPFLVGPGQTYVQPFPNRGTFYVACSVKASESITVHVE